MSYTSPTLEFLGTVAGLTASDVKCTPGGDGGYTHYQKDGQGGWVSIADGGAGPAPDDAIGRINNDAGCIHDTDPRWPLS